jgi:hypothetical protein
MRHKWRLNHKPKTCYNEIRKILRDDIEPIEPVQLVERYRLAPNLHFGILTLDALLFRFEEATMSNR